MCSIRYIDDGAHTHTQDSRRWSARQPTNANRLHLMPMNRVHTPLQRFAGWRWWRRRKKRKNERRRYYMNYIRCFVFAPSSHPPITRIAALLTLASALYLCSSLSIFSSLSPDSDSICLTHFIRSLEYVSTARKIAFVWFLSSLFLFVLFRCCCCCRFYAVRTILAITIGFLHLRFGSFRSFVLLVFVAQLK